jgi:hypothetical protein
VKKYFISLILLSSVSFSALGEEVFLLTHPLNFSEVPGRAGVQISVGAQPTLMKRLSSENGVTRVQIFQENGKAVNKIRYLSEHWFEQGTSLSNFEIDPNKIIADVNDPDCDEEAINDETNRACAVLDTQSSDVNLYTHCYETIHRKLNIKGSDSAYVTISKLYTLPENQQRFMAMLLTMYGEARGTKPPELHMASIMRIIDNRLRIAKQRHLESTELDVVLQNSQFSMFNPRDPNWKAAITANSEKMMNALNTYATQSTYAFGTKRSGNNGDNVFHYMTSSLFNSGNISWATRPIEVTVNNTVLKSRNAHVFFDNIPWSFSPSNRYKEYAHKKGLVK